MGRADWTVAVDDGLLGLPAYCTQCGGRHGPGWWDVAHVGDITLAIKVCERCRAADPQRTQLAAMLQARYDNQRIERETLCHPHENARMLTSTTQANQT